MREALGTLEDAAHGDPRGPSGDEIRDLIGGQLAALDELAQLRAEAARMRPVVEAAEVWRDARLQRQIGNSTDDEYLERTHELARSVDAMRGASNGS